MKKDEKFFYANPLKRLVAFVIDLFIIGLICYGLLALVGLANTQDMNEQVIGTIDCATYILCLVIILFYFPFGESRTGTTFGKRTMRIKLVKLNGDVAGFITCFARELVIILDIVSLGFLLPFVTQKKQTVKDILTRTIVIDR